MKATLAIAGLCQNTKGHSGLVIIKYVCYVWVDVILLDNVCVRLGPGQKEAAVWPGTGNDDLNYLISTQRVGISLSGSAWFVVIP